MSDKVSLLATDESRVYDGSDGTIRTAPLITPRSNTLSAQSTRTRLKASGRIFKRGIVGSFHKVSRKYMPLYVAEFQFRYNNRNNPDIFRTAIEGC